MFPEAVTVDHLFQQATRLPDGERVRLIQLLAETLVAPTSVKRRPSLWHYGALAGEKMSTEADFLLAEWHPTDEELDGT